MDFYAGVNRKSDHYPQGIWSPLNMEPKYTDAFYKRLDSPNPEEWGDEEFNPNWDPELELSLSNANMRMLFDQLGFDAEEVIPIDKFIGISTQWLKKHIGKQSKEVKPTISQQPGKATMIGGGVPEGYSNSAIYKMNRIAKKLKERGATHVWAA